MSMLEEICVAFLGWCEEVAEAGHGESIVARLRSMVGDHATKGDHAIANWLNATADIVEKRMKETS
jgi:hypothetical protein